MHLNRSFGSLGTLVAQTAAGSVESVLLRVNRQHSEDHRRVAVGVK